MVYFFTAVSFLAAASTAAALVQSGTYSIYNRVLSPAGEKLAITFNGNNEAAIVNVFVSGNTTQQWIIGAANSDGAQTISPASQTGLQAGWGNTGVEVIPAGNYVWIITSGVNGSTIQDGGKTVNWNLQSPTVDSQVNINADAGTARFRWILQSV